MNLTDTLTLDGFKRTSDGYLVANVRAARIGVQEYLGSEVGRPDLSTVRVYRPEAEVFNKDAMASFTSIPLTVDHPNEAVTANNWRKYAVGNTGEDIARDGEFIRVPIIVKDASAIRAIETGKRQLSMGYTTDLKWEAGTTPDGFTFDAIQTNLHGNHLAIVSAARGGSSLTIDGDNPVPEALKIIRDGVTIEVNDAFIASLDAKIAKLTGDIAARDTQIGTLTATISTKDGEIAGLTSKLTDAALTPDKLDAAVAARSVIVDAARAVLPTIDVTGKTDAEIRRATVAAKLGDAATAMNDDAIAGAFSALTAGGVAIDPVRKSLNDQTRTAPVGQQAIVDAARKAAADMNAWRNVN